MTNPSGQIIVPAGVTSVAAAIVGRGGNGNSTNFPLAHRPGGGARWSSSDNIPVAPGQSIRFRTVNVSVGGVIVVRYEMYIDGVNGNATVLSAISGLPGDPPDNNGAGGSSGFGPTAVSGQSGSDSNRGGSSGAAGGVIPNTTNGTDGYGIVPGADSWAYVHADGWGRGAASINAGGSTSAGSWGAIVVWGPGKGFSSGPGSYWPDA